MAKRRTHHKKGFTIPLAIVAGFTPTVAKVVSDATTGKWGYSAAIMHAGAGIVGYDTYNKKQIGWAIMQEVGVPAILLGFGAHWAASKLGINRMIARAGIPFLRI